MPATIASTSPQRKPGHQPRTNRRFATLLVLGLGLATVAGASGCTPSSSSSPSTQADFAALCNAQIGKDTTATATTAFSHPTIGQVTVVSCGPSHTDGASDHAGVLALSSTGAISWTTGVLEEAMQSFAIANPATDTSGNLFVSYASDDHLGVMIMRPSPTGFDILSGTRTQFRDIPLNFYFAELIGPDTDGLYQISQHNNGCMPSCGTEVTTTQVFMWNGANYVPSVSPSEGPGAK